MANIIYEYENESGEKIYVNVSGSTSGRRTRGDSDKTEIKRIKVKFEKALSTVKATANALKNIIDQVNPDEAKVEFSLKTEGEAGFFSLCKASTGAEFKISLTWGKSDTKSNDAKKESKSVKKE